MLPKTVENVALLWRFHISAEERTQECSAGVKPCGICSKAKNILMSFLQEKRVAIARAVVNNQLYL